MSLRPSRLRSPLACSGLMYVGVPTIMPVAVSFDCHLAHRPRDAEVGHQHLVARQQDVVGLDVAVHHALGVGVGERVGGRPA